MTRQNSAVEGQFGGIPAIWLHYGAFEAAVIPSIGANLVAFRDVERGHRYLREPNEARIEEFKAAPAVYGIPVLSPPNRYEDGRFPWDGKVYQLPVNEPATGNHLHGFLHDIEWKVEGYGSDDLESYVLLSQQVKEGHVFHKYLPFTFTVTLRYSLSVDGLQIQLKARNEGAERMPALFAFHTAINVPFVPDSAASDYTAKITIGQRRELNGRSLPTGQFQPLSPEEQQMKAEGVSPFFEAMDHHYTSEPQDGRNYMELTNLRTGDKLVYDVGTAYKHWMIWNNNTEGGFFCPEPQMNLVNAPNLPEIPAEESGLIGLEPGELFEQSSRLYPIRPRN
ncbi:MULTISPECIES: aldose 1-epimerase [unclassified Paenibacillus]|uniref:aldose 1-epimerase n=1 Tax=unclassified Paenibacillus TaxID=185978 RepID=UPI001F24E794|nr:aldose 1-epimerase [Paenibacillus sp. JJ-223]CAH1199481.1 Aldose 1-epimerase [Paenibacillus sp. JJ-223]